MFTVLQEGQQLEEIPVNDDPENDDILQQLQMEQDQQLQRQLEEDVEEEMQQNAEKYDDNDDEQDVDLHIEEDAEQVQEDEEQISEENVEFELRRKRKKSWTMCGTCTSWKWCH
jgi:hypothetical protein